MNCNLLIKSFLVGFIGDAILQLIVYLRGDLAGLKGYFQQHGMFESLCIAGGIMFLATLLFLLLRIPFTLFNLFLWGGFLDILWRQFNLMDSLKDTYYASLSWWMTFIWGGIPMIMVGLIGQVR
jgi:hypothetical protein